LFIDKNDSFTYNVVEGGHMPDVLRVWAGTVKITTAMNQRTNVERPVTIHELNDGTRRVLVDRVGEGEIILQHDGKFNNQHFAVISPSGMPQIHRASGNMETHEGIIQGRFQLTRNGQTTLQGTFQVSLRIPAC
jgi:hypothetical protein